MAGNLNSGRSYLITAKYNGVRSTTHYSTSVHLFETLMSRLYKSNGFLKYYTFIKASESQCQSSGTTSEVIKHTTLGVVPEEKDVEHLGKTI